MRSSGTRLASLALMAAGMSAAASSLDAPRMIFESAPGSYARPHRRAGYGWTNAHAKRVATKKRNVRKHRAANR